MSKNVVWVQIMYRNLLFAKKKNMSTFKRSRLQLARLLQRREGVVPLIYLFANVMWRMNQSQGSTPFQIETRNLTNFTDGSYTFIMSIHHNFSCSIRFSFFFFINRTIAFVVAIATTFFLPYSILIIVIGVIIGFSQYFTIHVIHSSHPC